MNEQPPPTLMTVDLEAFLRCLREIVQPPGPLAHASVDKSALFEGRGAVYHGGIVWSEGDDIGYLTVYDGLDTSGEVLDRYACGAGVAERHILERGVGIREGLYISRGAGTFYVTIYYQPAPREKA